MGISKIGKIRLCFGVSLVAMLLPHIVAGQTAKCQLPNAGTIVYPDIPKHSISMGDEGGIRGGDKDNSMPFGKAISYLDSQGCGSLIIPSGVWQTGPLELEKQDLSGNPKKCSLEIHTRPVSVPVCRFHLWILIQ